MNQKHNTNIKYYIQNLNIGTHDTNSHIGSEVSQSAPYIKHPFWHAVKQIILNKDSSNGRYLTGAFALILSYFFNVLAFTCGGIAVCFLISGIREILDMLNCCSFSLLQTIKFLLGTFIFCILILFGLLLRGSANDIEREEDRNYVVSVFSAITSFSALIVSFMSYLNTLS